MAKPLWTYASSGGERYPVQAGEIWTAGPHRIACGDLERGDAIALLDKIRPEFVYTDPPWNAGNAASFRTKAALEAKVDFRRLLHRVIDAIITVRRYAFIEMGRQNGALLEELLLASGAVILARWPITYYRLYPALLFCVTWTDQPPPAIDLSGLDDEATPHRALALAKPGDLVFDPCTGRGLTARTANYLRCQFIGLELSPWRTSATLWSLHRMGLPVVRDGHLTPQAA